MARFYYECDLDLKNDTAEIKPYACTPDKYCLYCNAHCCLLVQKRSPRHLWGAWYFWLGIALLAVFIISSVSSYIVSNYRHNVQGVPFRNNARLSGNRQTDRTNRPGSSRNEFSISIIPSAGLLPSHRKTLVIASQPAVAHLTPVVA